LTDKKVTLLMLKNCDCGNCGSLARLCRGSPDGYTYFCEDNKSKRPEMTLAESDIPCRFWRSEDKRK